MKTKYLVYDIETVPDLELFRRIKYPQCETVEDAVNVFADEERSKGNKSPFIPSTFHYPVSCVVLKVAEDFSQVVAPVALPVIGDSHSIDRPYQIVKQFWDGVQTYRSVLVDFNGRTFDMPVMLMNAMSLGVSCPAYFADDRFGYRYRYTDRHIDLMDWVTGYGAFRLNGGLDLCAKLVGGLGKTGTSGSDVASMWADGRIEEIDQYCMQDVMDTYRLFLRTRRMMGLITEKREEQLLQ